MLTVLVPFLNLAFPPSSALHMPTYLVALFGKYVCYAILALSIDLIWGYVRHSFAGPWRVLRARRLRHGHVSDAADRHPRRLCRPDPAGLHGVPELEGAAGLLVFLRSFLVCGASWSCWCPALLAFVFGWFAFRSRVTGVYLSIITQALTFALLLGFFRNNFGFGGNNGLTDFKDILGYNVQAQGTRAALFAISCIALGIGFLSAARWSLRNSARCWSRSATPKPARASSAIAPNPTSCSCSRCRPAWPASPARSMCRR